MQFLRTPTNIFCQIKSGRNILANSPQICRRINQTPIYRQWNPKSRTGIGMRSSLEEYYKLRDKIPSNYEIIYKAPMEYYVSVAKHFSNFSLVFISGMIGYKLLGQIKLIEIDEEYKINGITAFGDDLLKFGIAFLLFHIGILYVCNMYPLRIWKCKTNYIAIFEGYLPRAYKHYSFAKGDLTPNTTSRLPWFESVYNIKNKSVLMYIHYFRTPLEMHLMYK